MRVFSAAGLLQFSIMCLRMDGGCLGSVTRDTGPAGTAGQQRKHDTADTDNIPERAEEGELDLIEIRKGARNRL